MILLTTTSDILQLTTDSSTPVDVHASYMDFTAPSTFTPGRTNTAISTAATTTIVGAPGSSVVRNIKTLAIHNISATGSVYTTVKHYDGSTTVQLIRAQLTAGETLLFTAEDGFRRLSQTGYADTPSTYWNGDQFLINGGTSPALNLGAITVEPSAPASGSLLLYAKTVAGRAVPKAMGPSGVDYPLQSNIGFNNISLIGPGSGTTPGVIGCTITNVGTVSHPTPASTNFRTQHRRFTNTSAATASSLASTRVAVMECWRGNAVGYGGFFMVCRFGLTTIGASGLRAFFGLSDTATTAPTNIDPLTSTTPGRIGMAINSNSGNWYLINNITASAPTTLNLGTDFPVDTTSTFELILYSKPNGTSVYYRVTNMGTGAQTSGELSTNIPTNSTFLGRQAWACNHTVASAIAWDMSRFYLESDT